MHRSAGVESRLMGLLRVAVVAHHGRARGVLERNGLTTLSPRGAGPVTVGTSPGKIGNKLIALFRTYPASM